MHASTCSICASKFVTVVLFQTVTVIVCGDGRTKPNKAATTGNVEWEHKLNP